MRQAERARKAAGDRAVAAGAAIEGSTRPPPAGATPSPRLRTGAWLLRGISSIPGELNLNGGTVSFVAFDTGSAWPWQLRKLERDVGMPGIAESIDRAERSLVFKWPMDTVAIWCPWYYFGGGIKLRRGPLVLRFSFGTPANMQARGVPGDALTALQNTSENLEQVGTMRSRGAQWKAASKVAPGADAAEGKGEDRVR